MVSYLSFLLVLGQVEILHLKAVNFGVMLGSRRLFWWYLGCGLCFLVTKLEALLCLVVILVLLVPK